MKELRTQDQIEAELQQFVAEAMEHGHRSLKIARIVLGDWNERTDWMRAFRLHFALAGRNILLKRLLVRLGYDNARLDGLLLEDMAALEREITEQLKRINEEAEAAANSEVQKTDGKVVRRMMRVVKGGKK